MTAPHPPPAGAGLLGLNAGNTADLIREVRNGFDPATVNRFLASTGLTQKQSCLFAAIPPRSLSRRTAGGRLSPERSDRVLRAARLFEQATDAFGGDAAAARAWLQAPARSLGGESPLVLAATEVGAREVERVLGRLEHGVFT